MVGIRRAREAVESATATVKTAAASTSIFVKLAIGLAAVAVVLSVVAVVLFARPAGDGMTHTRTYTYPRTFTGYRPNPPEEYEAKGITNGGRTQDYEGVIFSDGTVVLRWMTEYRSHSVWARWGDFYQVHGHPEYGTVIEFSDGGDAP